MDATAQYFVSGNSPASYKWKQLYNYNKQKIIYPNFAAPEAVAVGRYMDVLKPYITFGMAPKIDKLPVLLLPGNLNSNGMVTWAPKRMEINTPPPINSYAMPWLKEVTTHEYRHVVQMSNLNVGFTRALSYILGEQAIGLIALIPNGWYFEGDAVVAETQMSMYGRGRQPDFTITYRAMLNEDERYFKYDKMVLGSYTDFVPSKYNFGYQIVSSANNLYGDDFWGKVIRFCGRNPYFITSTSVAYHKYIGTSSTKMAYRAFSNLKDFWAPYAKVNNSTTIATLPQTSYTDYTSPIKFYDGSVIAHRHDGDQQDHFIVADSTLSKAQKLEYASFLSSRPIVEGKRLLWTEFRPSLFYEQKNSSVVRALQIEKRGNKYKTSRPKTLLSGRNIFLVTPTPSLNNGYVMVEYNNRNSAAVLFTDSTFREIKSFALPDKFGSVSGLAFDDKTSTAALIILDQSGKWIGIIDPSTGEITPITKPSYVTVSNLTASNGNLYFNSIESGKDEAHTIDLATGKEYRITTSKYGSSYASDGQNNSILTTTYTRSGYKLAHQKIITDSLHAVEYKRLPTDLFTPYRGEQDLIKLDTINFADSLYQLSEPFKTKPYRKGANMFGLHSWIPFGFNVTKLLDERNLDIGFGATLLSQNTLSDIIVEAGYAWIPGVKESLIFGSVAYTGLPVHFGLNVEYGGGSQDVYLPAAQPSTPNDPSLPAIKKYLKIEGKASLPMNFSDGRMLRKLEPFVTFGYYNSLMYHYSNNTISTGMGKMQVGISWQNYTPMATKDLAPRLGYQITLQGVFNPMDKEFGKLINLYGLGYFPGIAQNHALVVGANIQYQNVGNYNYKQKTLYPWGCQYNFTPEKVYSTSVNYKFPLAYPDGGISGLIYFKRIALDFFGQYSRVELPSFHNSVQFNAYTYGGTASIDFNVLRISTDIKLGLSVYKPNDSDKPKFSASVGFNF